MELKITLLFVNIIADTEFQNNQNNAAGLFAVSPKSGRSPLFTFTYIDMSKS